MAGPIDVGSLIQQVFANNQSLQPMRDEARQAKVDIADDGNLLIEAMAKQSAAVRASTLAEQTSKLGQQEAVLLRQRQLGLDANNPASDRMAKLASYLEEESTAHRSAVERSQQLQQTGVFPNPIKWLIDQMELEGVEKQAATALSAKQAYLQEMQGIHTLAQENVQTIVQSKLAKTQGELQATLDQQAAEATKLATEQRQLNAHKNLSAINAVYNMTADEHGVWFKAAQLQADQANRERDASQDALRYKMLELQYNDALKDRDGKAAVVGDMRRFAVENLGADPNAIKNAPDELILNHKQLKDSYLTTFGIGSPRGPYSALNAIESMRNPNNYLLSSPVANWVKEKMASIPVTPELLKAKEEDRNNMYDTSLLMMAEQELAGDADNSKIYRLPSIGELRNIPGLAKLPLFKKYLSTAPDTTRYGMKQVIGFALKDPTLAVDGTKRAMLVRDIARLAQISVNYTSSGYLPSAYGLPDQRASSAGYKVMPTEILQAANANLPEAMKKRFFDLTKEGDVQLLVSLAMGGAAAQTGRQRLFGVNFGQELRATDPIERESRTGKKPSRKDKE